MCGKVILAFITTFAFSFSNAQVIIKGTITNSKNEPLEGVSISVKDSYSGTTTAQDGSYSFLVSDQGTKLIVVTMMGFVGVEKEITIKDSLILLNIQLKEAITDMKAVIITAGSFEASDKKRGTVLKSIDIVTTAGQQADVVAALKTLPGAQQVGEQEGLFVRGGTGAETRVFIDGMMVTNPFFSSVPGIAQRARFSPLLFKGTVFSTGGYSAQYGQGLSSVLILESIDLPSRSEVNMIISSPQVSVMSQKLNKAKNGSTGLTVNYSNLNPYFRLVPQKYHYTKAPEAVNAEFNFRHKVRNGIFKVYAYSNYNEVGFDRPSLDHQFFNERFFLQNRNAFANATYSGRLKNDWLLYAGTSVSYNQDRISLQTANSDTVITSFKPELTNRLFQSKVVVTKNFAGLTRIHIGSEYQNISDGVFARDSIAKRQITDNYLAGFIESDIYYSSALVSRMGARFEYSTLLKKAVIAPRLSLAYKLNHKSQFSFAYGVFYQKPETNFLLRKPSLDNARATHYILNFQRTHNGQILRIETFYKNYTGLITTDANDPAAIQNNGNGYAKGVELFWRDKTSIPHLDYWVSYSFLDTKRKYLNYPALTQPSFAAKHTLNIVAKRFVNILSTQFNATYSYASGRPYHDPNKSDKGFMNSRTIEYHSLGLQANYLRTFGNINAVFIMNISNALGSKQVFGYRFANVANAQGEYASEAMTPMAKRFIFIGMYLSIGADRRKSILD
ncbi:MAG TPA: TonB-dependent receptor [Chitinophagaceae bacterium]